MSIDSYGHLFPGQNREWVNTLDDVEGERGRLASGCEPACNGNGKDAKAVYPRGINDDGALKSSRGTRTGVLGGRNGHQAFCAESRNSGRLILTANTAWGLLVLQEEP